MKPWIETWMINQRITEYLLQDIPESSFSDQYAGKSRDVAALFAHIHNVRLMWIKPAQPELLAGLKKIDKEEAPLTKKALLAGLKDSAEAMTTVLKNGFEAGKIKGFKPHPEAFLGYLIAHEAHHRAEIIVALKENGHMPDKKILFGLWEWGSR